MVSRIAQVKKDDLSNYLRSPAQIEIMGVEEPASNLYVKLKISHGNYKSLEDILNAIDNLNFINDHLKFEINAGGFVKIVKKSKENVSYSISMSKHIRNILGLINEKNIYVDNKNQFTFLYPASWNNGLPSTLYVYTDICEPYITEDSQSPLLRKFSLNKNNYGSYSSKEFIWLNYIPLQRTEFQTIEINIRDQHGRFIPFEYGTLTVTLHFKAM